jgi:drug/metabolite transporter (DMT)-like permease
MRFATWHIVLIMGIAAVLASSLLMAGGAALSKRVAPNDDQGATRAPAISVDGYPLQSPLPSSLPGWYLFSSSTPTRDLE